ncbi:gamma-glutamyl kinase [Alteromonas mediterranea 615]|uniref:Gamma-glutamyl kinase n=1 Tax=Alteromonas mediterranea 615 TaxID=1300253 RepID=S5AIQ2_9ALTE|nr:gamma-glutamyl kinase [Alteromonas mediterranea 615]
MNRFTWQRAVIKVGSALIAPEGNECSGRYLLSLARFITASREAGKEVFWSLLVVWPLGAAK